MTEVETRSVSDRMKIRWRQMRRSLLKPLIAYPGQALMWMLLWTCRIKVEGAERLIQQANQGPCFLMMWHNRIFCVAHSLWHNARDRIYAIVVSKSRDGDLLAAMADTYKLGRTLRVPHDARHKALKEMVRRVKGGEVLLVTPDGPRGPRYEVKAGIAFAALAAKAAVVPYSWAATRFWQLKSWDRLIIPKPFSQITVKFGEPIPHEALQSVEIGTHLLENRLKTLTEELESETGVALD